MLKNLIIILFLFNLFSCGKNADEKTIEAILTANIALGSSDCQTAIDVLETNGRINKNAAYLKTLASAYACRAGYSTVTFFTSDFTKTVTPAPLGGTTTYSTSSTAVASTLQNDSNYSDMQTAINILLYAGGIPSGIEPTAAERAKYFTTSEAADINSQLLYLVLVQLGRYGYFYGDSTSSGVNAGKKGSGPGSNTCFTSYTSAIAGVKAAITTAAGTCTNITTDAASHAQLSNTLTAATRKTRLCQGVVLLNGVFALLPSVVSSVFSNAADQAAATAAIAVLNVAKTALITADSTTTVVANTLNQSVCEDDSVVSVSNIESYFGLMFEGSFR